MKKKNDQTGRILRHGKRAAEVTDEAIAIRARELAIIDGRSAEEVTEEDLARSRAELRGEHLPDTTLEDAVATAALTRDPSEPASHTGVQAPEQNEPEDQEVMERLVLEGVEEAQHDQMLADRHRRTNQ
ncbi:MAG: hypothetical protein K0R17_1710 [Rariglobus sp.]|jgi:hypothetical protein|nr:hypothetical protein [Rariglobus sp.]